METINEIKNMTNVSAQAADDFFVTYGFEVEKNGNKYELCYNADGIHGDVIDECEADNDDEAFIYLVNAAIEYAENNGLKPTEKEEVEIGSDEYIIRELAKFLRDETLEECPIKIVSREDIENEEAELVRFTFGECEDSCVAIVYADGTTYTPNDWQTPVWDEEDWEISDTENWMDCCFRPCIMFNGMPRRLF